MTLVALHLSVPERQKFEYCVFVKHFAMVDLSFPTDWTLLRVRGPAAMAGLLARPSPCDWLALRCIHCPHSRYHCQPTVIGSGGSAQKNIQILAFIICYTLARPDLFD